MTDPNLPDQPGYVPPAQPAPAYGTAPSYGQTAPAGAKAMTYYTKALNMEPTHLGANEYMGELYLEMNDLPKAEERLAVLKNACGDCDEFDDLEDEIEDYKEEHGLS